MNINPMLLLDFYKTTHPEQYPRGLSRLVSYYIARMSRIPDENYLIAWDIQGTINRYLVEAFNRDFFRRPKGEIMDYYQRLLDHTLKQGVVKYQRIADLHDLGYLPLEIKAVPEGTKVPIRVPMIEITNTHPDFAWLVNTIETVLSCSSWHSMISANVGYRYRKIVNHFYDISVNDDIPRARAIGDFSMRGQESCESAISSSAGFCLSFLNTATVPVIPYLERYYDCNITKEAVAFGAVSTEHSVMNSNFAVDGDEITMIKRLLTEIYPGVNISMVADSYDYWNIIDNVLPQCRKEICEHKGYFAPRGDSGDPVEICVDTVKRLWRNFGGEKNTKGFNVLIPQLRMIYGDSITPQRLTKIYEGLIQNGFACNNVIPGAGSFSLQCLEQPSNFPAEHIETLTALRKENPSASVALTSAIEQLTANTLSPFTRDTFGIAVKSSYCEVNGKPIHIFKDPKTDTGNFKKSQKGCCVVFEEGGNITYRDQLDYNEAANWEGNLLQPLFRNSEMVREESLSQIRARLHDNKF